jgi:hypothetical protein
MRREASQHDVYQVHSGCSNRTADPVHGTDRHKSTLRLASRTARSAHSFDIASIFIVPDHLHWIFTLPESNVDFSHGWRRMRPCSHKAYYAPAKPSAGRTGQAAASGKDVSGSTPSATMSTSVSMSIVFTKARPGMDWNRVRRIGRTRRSTGPFAEGSSRRIGGRRRRRR